MDIPGFAPDVHSQELLDELRAFQIELEAQDQVLLRAHAAVEEFRARYLSVDDVQDSVFGGFRLDRGPDFLMPRKKRQN